MPFNVFPLVNTCHSLGFSAFLMVYLPETGASEEQHIVGLPWVAAVANEVAAAASASGDVAAAAEAARGAAELRTLGQKA